MRSAWHVLVTTAVLMTACQRSGTIVIHDAGTRDDAAGGSGGGPAADAPARHDAGAGGRDGSSDGTAAAGTGGAADASADRSPADAGAETFTGAMPCAAGTALPALDKSCGDVRECVAVFHQINCCGTKVALGISKSDLAAFTQAERACAASYPQCGCPTLPTRTEDGSSSSGLDGDIGVTCRAGRCTTFIKACQGPCGPGTTCACCPSGPTNYCLCTTTGCTADQDCEDPARSTCQRGGSSSLCTGTGVTCFVP
jgi:hypothetical protein